LSRILSFFLGIAAVLAGFLVEAAAAPVIGATRDAHLLWVAEAHGHFDAFGIAPELRLYESERELVAALEEGEAELAAISEFAFVRAAFAPPELRLLASLGSLRACHLVARRDRGIEAVADLAGGVVAAGLDGLGEFFLTRTLALHGLDRGDVELKDGVPAEIVARLTEGSVDAGLLCEPRAHEARERLGSDSASWSAQGGSYFYSLLVVRADYLAEAEATVDAVIAALARAEERIRRDPDAAKAVLGERLGFDADLVDAYWAGQHPGLALPQNLLWIMDQQARWLIEGNRVGDRAAFDSLALIDFGPLERVRPHAITIYR